MNHGNRGVSYEAAVSLLQHAYAAFNNRNIEAVLQLMHIDVQWPNGWEGGYVHGHDEVRNYWQRQWAAINPYVEPVSFTEMPDGRININVHQLVKDLNGTIIANGLVNHIYTIENSLIRSMEIVTP